jgi:hypothetical protein
MSNEQKQENIKEFDLKKGLTFAIISGVLSACFNYGIEAGDPIADAAVARDTIHCSRTTSLTLFCCGAGLPQILSGALF